MTDIQTYNADIAKQEKTSSQQANWVETNEINNLWEKMKKDVDLLYKKLIGVKMIDKAYKTLCF